jgi:type IV pilus assembly protein PilE
MSTRSANPKPAIRVAGFTLIELLVAVAILGIIMAVAIPSYNNYVTRSNRAEGKAAIMQAAQALERCFTRYNAYNAADCNLSFPIDSENDWYEITVNRDAATYTLTATPQAAQASRDTECANLTLTHTGQRGISGSGAVQDCW